MRKRPAPHHPSLLTLEPYVPGRSAIAGRDKVIKLSSNENPFGCSPRVEEVLDQNFALHRYPDGGHSALREAIAEMYTVNPEQVVCGVGSDELINLLADAYAGEGDDVLYSEHGFLMYPIAATRVGATPVAVQETGLKADVESLIAALTEDTKLLYLANPNNPTGSYLSEQELYKLHKALPEDVLLVIDNAYAEYVTAEDYTDGRELVAEFDNVVITQTFSKIYGLGGMRVGWCVAPPHIAETLNRIRSPFNLSVVAQELAVAALNDQDFVEQSAKHNSYWRNKLSKALGELGFTVYPSEANFILMDCEDARWADKLNGYLLDKGIIVRQVGAYKLPSCLRVTVGLEAENEAFLNAIEQFIDEHART